MNFHRLFLLLVVAIFLVLGGHSGVEAAPRWKLGKKLVRILLNFPKLYCFTNSVLSSTGKSREERVQSCSEGTASSGRIQSFGIMSFLKNNPNYVLINNLAKLVS